MFIPRRNIDQKRNSVLSALRLALAVLCLAVLAHTQASPLLQPTTLQSDVLPGVSDVSDVLPGVSLSSLTDICSQRQNQNKDTEAGNKDGNKDDKDSEDEVSLSPLFEWVRDSGGPVVLGELGESEGDSETDSEEQAPTDNEVDNEVDSETLPEELEDPWDLLLCANTNTDTDTNTSTNTNGNVSSESWQMLRSLTHTQNTHTEDTHTEETNGNNGNNGNTDTTNESEGESESETDSDSNSDSEINNEGDSDSDNINNNHTVLNKNMMFESHQSGMSTSIHIYMAQSSNAGAKGTLIVKLQPVPLTLDAGTVLSFSFPSDSFNVTPQSIGGSKEASYCTLATSIKNQISNTLMAINPYSISFKLSVGVSAADGYIQATCTKANAPTHEVVVGVNLGDPSWKAISATNAVVKSEEHSQYLSDTTVTPAKLAIKPAFIDDDGGVVVLFMVPYGVASSDSISLVTDVAWYSTTPTACEVSGRESASEFTVLNNKAYLNVKLPGNLGANTVYYVKCKNMQIPKSSAGATRGSMRIVTDKYNLVRLLNNDLEMPLLENKVGGTDFTIAMDNFISGVTGPLTVKVNRFPVKVTSNMRVELTLPSDITLATDAECKVSQMFATPANITTELTRSSTASSTVLVFTVGAGETLTEYPVDTHFTCDLATIAVSNSARAVLKLRLLPPLSSADQTTLYSTNTGKIPEIHPAPFAYLGRASTVSNKVAGENSELTMIYQPINARLDRYDVLSFVMDERYVLLENSFCNIFAYNDHTNIMNIGGDNNIKINAQTLNDALNPSRFGLRITESGSRQLDLLSRSLTYLRVVCSMIRNPQQEVSFAGSMTVNVYSGTRSNTTTITDAMTGAQVLNAFTRPKASLTDSILPLITPNVLGSVVRQLYFSSPFSAVTGTMVVVVNALSNPVAPSQQGGSIRFTLPVSWTVNAGGYPTQCSVDRPTPSGSVIMQYDTHYTTVIFKPTSQVTAGPLLMACTNIRSPVTSEGVRDDLHISTYKDDSLVDTAANAFIGSVGGDSDITYIKALTTVHTIVVERGRVLSGAEMIALTNIYNGHMQELGVVAQVIDQRVDVGHDFKVPVWFANYTETEDYYSYGAFSQRQARSQNQDSVADTSSLAFDDEADLSQTRVQHTMQMTGGETIYVNPNTQLLTVSTVMRSASRMFKQRELISRLNTTSNKNQFASQVWDVLGIKVAAKLQKVDDVPLPAECKNGQLDLEETDIDCGGPTCKGCGSGKKCLVSSDCLSKDCRSNRCVGGNNSFLHTNPLTVTFGILISILLPLVMYYR